MFNGESAWPLVVIIKVHDHMLCNDRTGEFELSTCATNDAVLYVIIHIIMYLQMKTQRSVYLTSIR